MVPRNVTEPANSAFPGRSFLFQISGKRPRRFLLLFIAVSGAALTLMYWDVVRHGKPIVADPKQIPAMPVAIVFGAGYSNRHGPGAVLFDRVQSGVELYRSGKVRKLLMTGDNGHVGYSEPAAMRRCALSLGVPDRDIVMDFAGFRTYDSLWRARDVFGVRQAVLVTQRYHLPRALYLAHALGLRVVGYPADRAGGYGAVEGPMHRRELLAIENAWLEVNLLHPHPRFLGKPEIIQFQKTASVTSLSP